MLKRHFCKLSMGLEKLKFHEIVSMLQNNNFYWSIASCICRVMDALIGKLLVSSREATVAFRYCLVQLLVLSIFTRQMHLNHEPIVEYKWAERY